MVSEAPKRKKRVTKPKAIVIDMDGVIGDFLYTLTWLQNKLKGTSVSHNDIKTYNFVDLNVTDVRGNSVTGEELFATFKEWEPHGIYAIMPLLPHAREALVAFDKLGYHIILMTARDEQYKEQTRLWIFSNDLPYHELIFEKDKAKKIRNLSKQYNIQGFMDDNLDNIKDVSENTNVNQIFLIESPITRDVEIEEGDFEKVRDLWETTRYFKEVK